MNKEYIREIYEKNKENLIDSEYEIESPEELESMIKSYITSNLQYDFHIDIELDKLFDLDNEKNKENKHEDIEIEM